MEISLEHNGVNWKLVDCEGSLHRFSTEDEIAGRRVFQCRVKDRSPWLKFKTTTDARYLNRNHPNLVKRLRNMVRRQIAPQKFHGNAPIASGFELIGGFVAEYAHWDIYSRTHDTGWINMKLVAREGDERKANFHVAFNRAEQRFADNRDMATLREKRPDLLATLIRLMRDFGYIAADLSEVA